MLEDHREFEDELRDMFQGPVKIATVDRVVYELESLARRSRTKAATFARLGLELLDRKKVEVKETVSGLPDVDTAIMATALAEKNPVAVATVDREMRETLARHGIQTVHPRSRPGVLTLAPVRLK